MLHYQAPKRVLLLAPQPFFENRGTPINVRALAKHLSLQGYSVDLLTYPIGQKVDVAPSVLNRSLKVPFIKSVPPGPSIRKVVLDVGFLFSSLKLALTRKYDVFHGVEEAGVIAVMLGKLFGKKSVYDMDSNITEQLRSSGFLSWRPLLSLVSAVENYCLRSSDAVLSVCKDLSASAGKVVGKEKIYQIEDFPIEGSLLVDTVLRDKLYEDYGLRGKDIVVYTGNFEKYQGIDLLIESFAKLSRDALLVLVGDGERRPVLEAKVEELKLGEKVIFTGSYPSSSMGTFMNLATVLASPRTVGGNTPLKLYSYLDSGTPVVATNIVSHISVVSDAECFLSNPDTTSFAAALEAALVNKGQAEEKAANARKLVAENYSEEQFSKKLAFLYSQIFEESVKQPVSVNS